MTRIMVSLFRYNMIPLIGFWLLGPLALLIVAVVGTEHAANWTDVLRLPLMIPTHYLLFVIALLVAVIHLPIYVAHGVSRREFATSAGLFIAAVAGVYAVLTSVGNAVYDRFLSADGILSAADVARSLAAHLAFNLIYMVSGWMVGLAYYRFHPWLATLLVPLALTPVFVTEWIFDHVWEGPSYTAVLNYRGHFGFWGDLGLGLAVIGAGALAAWFFAIRMPLRAKRA